MTTFIIEDTKYDFSNQLIQSIDFVNWFRGQKELNYIISKNVTFKNMIPIGSLEFVSKYLKIHYGKDLGKPIHIPDDLMKETFLLRKCGYANRDLIPFNEKLFVKNVDQYKGYTELKNSIEDIPKGNYFYSEIVNISSEYRCFVFKRELKGIHFYSGDFRVFPDVEQIESMIKAYDKCPVAYTLDVGVNERGTFVIEVHPLVSCGLYGFRDNALPYMLMAGYQHIVNNPPL